MTVSSGFNGDIGRSLYKKIRVVIDQIEAGELNLFEVDLAKAEEAKKRIEAKRAKDRAYRLRNIEKERARDRERCACKKALHSP